MHPVNLESSLAVLPRSPYPSHPLAASLQRPPPCPPPAWYTPPSFAEPRFNGSNSSVIGSLAAVSPESKRERVPLIETLFCLFETTTVTGTRSTGRGGERGWIIKIPRGWERENCRRDEKGRRGASRGTDRGESRREGGRGSEGGQLQFF